MASIVHKGSNSSLCSMHQNAEERIANQVSGMDNISLQGKYNSLGFVSAPFVFKYVDDRITLHKNTQEKVPSGQVTSIFLGNPVITSQPGIFGTAGPSNSTQEYPRKSTKYPSCGAIFQEKVPRGQVTSTFRS